MKAKVIKTGEIINVIPMEGGWAANFVNGARHFEDSELDFSFEDWEKFRREAANSVLSRLASWNVSHTISDDVKLAISYADELVKQLREEKK